MQDFFGVIPPILTRDGINVNPDRQCVMRRTVAMVLVIEDVRP